MLTDYIPDDFNHLSVTVDALMSIDMKSVEPGSPAWKLRTLFNMGLDFVHRNLQGAHPALGDIVALYQTPRSQLPAWLGQEKTCEAFTVCWKNPALREAALEIGPAPLTLGNPEIYLADIPEAVDALHKYETFLRRLSQLTGNYGAREAVFAENVIAIERSIAGAMSSADYDYDHTPEIMDSRKLDATFPALKPSCFLPSSWREAAVVLPGVVSEVDRLMASAPEEQLHDYIAARYLMTASSCLSDDFLFARFAFSGETPMNRRQLTATILYGIFGPDIETVAAGGNPAMPFEKLDINPRGTYWENIHAAMKLHRDFMTKYPAD